MAAQSRGTWLLPLRPLLIFAALVRGAAAGGGEVWWVHEYERSYVEVLMLMFLVALALVFETLWHQCLHMADHSYSFGRLHALMDSGDVHSGVEGGSCHDSHDMKHAQLSKELVNRAGGEFMTLGFLACTIFCWNASGGFKWMVSEFPSHQMHLPKTEEDWLHMAEIVHINLFVGMCIYFLVLTRIVQGCVQKLKSWEQLKLRRKFQHGLNTNVVSSPHGMRRIQFLDADLAEYIHWRQYFMMKMGDMLQRRPEMFTDILERIGLPPLSEPGVSGGRSGIVASFQEYLDREFAFSAYLAFSVEDGILDTIRIHPITWTFLLLLFFVFACVHRFEKVALSRLMPFFLTLVFILMVLMRYIILSKKNSIAKQASGLKVRSLKPLNAASELHSRHNTEIFLLRCLQILLFLMSYVFSRTLLDLDLWRRRPLEALLYASLFSLLFAALVHMLPESVPLFLGIMAMPPYVDETNFQTFRAVLECTREQYPLICGQVKSNRSISGGSMSLLHEQSPRSSATTVTKGGFVVDNSGKGEQQGSSSTEHWTPSPAIAGSVRALNFNGADSGDREGFL